ncbi:glucose 1-dehydrogenase [Nonomuraea sp. MCN248]|uniref:Glucose 1-dehydrogenase n=1 Tax=Nonomuraea corallina TaxID=2989783 RepID=A0ABT4SKN4_9ACTN|nr:glucose 1-dehydrogenase [Nonomuraea corallina]MDA0637739.1 glucose 1-dehydrogenase [Nonomuraea corallina]
MTAPLDGRVAVVTGGGSGIGRATVERFAADGARVVLADHAGSAAEVAAAIDPAGTTVVFQRADVRDAGQVDRAFQVAMDRFGRCDIAVNNAGVIAGGPLHADDADDQFDLVWRVCVSGVWHGCRSAVARMRENGGGVILNTASAAALWPTPAFPAYGLAKAAVLHLTRSLAAAYGRDGIRVNAVVPGPTRTGIFEAATADLDLAGLERRYAASMALGRMIEPEETAAAFAYLASDAARSITGTALQIDGGYRPGT